MDWHLLGNGVVTLECALILAWLCRIGVKGLRKLPVPVLIACLSLAVGTGIVAQKTNGVNNIPPVPMPPRSAPVVETVTEDDVARGWRVECVTTNETVSYEMPSNAVHVNNWHIHGARSSFGNNVIDLGSAGTPLPTSWMFPLGTNGAAFSSFWYFVDGRIRPRPKDTAHEICAVGVPMSAVPGLSRLWALAEDDDSRVLTWENFFLGGDTNAPVNAQIRLFANGDFTTRSNNVETVCRRVNPDDWDGDGIINDDDTSPFLCDGDFFGPANILPEGGNTNAYCTVSVVARGPDALITFTGDRPSDYPDPRFIAKSGVTNDVVVLIGKTYSVLSDFPISFVGSSDPETEIVPLRGSATRVCRPVTITCSGGNPFTMNVSPLNLGGVFSWQPLGCACTLSGTGDTFQFSCSQSCTCCGSFAEGTYAYEGYFLFASTCPCGCYYDGTGPVWTETPATPPYTNSVSASVSATFSAPAVIFEDAYENKPGEWVPRRSTRTRLNVIASGGLNGATLTVSATNLVKLSHLSGPGLPLAPVSVPAETSVSYSIVYDGLEASETQDDIAVTATVAENTTGLISSNACSATSIRLELAAVWEAPENPCTNRHVYGVGEKVLFKVYPQSPSVVLSTTKHDTNDVDSSEYELFGTSPVVDASSERTYTCPISANFCPPIRVTKGDVEYSPLITLVEPNTVITRGAEWGFNYVDIFYEGNRRCWPSGSVGTATLVTTNYIGPMDVSFRGIAVSEVPCDEEDTITGCFTNGHRRTHTFEGGAGRAHPIKEGNFWFVDAAHIADTISNWQSGGELIWKIPVGWHRKGASDNVFYVLRADHEINLGYDTRPLVFKSVYSQRFHVDQAGETRVDKFGHWTSRSRFCRVVLDGNTLQESHPTW